VSRGESARAVCATLSALEEAVQNDDTRSHGDDEANDAYVADHAPNDGHVVLRQVQSVVFVAPRAENLSGLYYLRRQAVAVHGVILAATRGNELRADS